MLNRPNSKLAAEFLRLSLTNGWRPALRATSAAIGISIVGAVSWMLDASVVWIVAAALVVPAVVLLCGAFSAWKAAYIQAPRQEHLPSLVELLEKRNGELARELQLSQAQYKVFEGWYREHPPARR